MTLLELDELQNDTRKMPRATDKVALSAAIASIEIARQLLILNATLGASDNPKAKAKGTGK